MKNQHTGHFSILLIVAVLVTGFGLLACSNVLPDTSFPVSISLNGGADNARTLAFSNGLVTSVAILVYDASGERIGSGNLTKRASDWGGNINVTATGTAIFEANALDANGKIYYVGRTTKFLSGMGDFVTIVVGAASLKGGTIQGYVPTLSATVNLFAGSTVNTAGSIEGTGTGARFTNPYGMATDGTNLFVATWGSNNIRKIVIASQVETIFAGKLGGEAAFTDGYGQLAGFANPSGITCDGLNLYVADYTNNAIRKIVIATGLVSTFAGSPSATGGYTDAAGTSATFISPSGITNDGVNLYVTDQGNHKIRQIQIAAPNTVTTLAGTATGLAGVFGSNDGTGTDARFNLPEGITTDGTNLYVADTVNHTIRQVQIAAPHSVTTLAGTAGTAGTLDGIGAVARFDAPRGITTDGTNLYVTDFLKHTIRKIVISTRVVTTLAGLAGTGARVDGIGTGAQFYGPSGITTDGTNLYVSEYSSHTIRKIQ